MLKQLLIISTVGILLNSYISKNINSVKYKQNLFNSQVDSLKNVLVLYDILSPFNEEDVELIYGKQIEIDSMIMLIFKNPLVRKIDAVNTFDGNALSVTHSEDSMVYMLTYDEKLGGSNRTLNTVLHYRHNGLCKSSSGFKSTKLSV